MGDRKLLLLAIHSPDHVLIEVANKLLGEYVRTPTPYLAEAIRTITREFNNRGLDMSVLVPQPQRDHHVP